MHIPTGKHLDLRGHRQTCACTCAIVQNLKSGVACDIDYVEFQLRLLKRRCLHSQFIGQLDYDMPNNGLDFDGLSSATMTSPSWKQGVRQRENSGREAQDVANFQWSRLI